MNKNEKKIPENLRPVKVDGVETIKLIVRNIDGEGVLFTEDGKMIGHQISNMGFYYYSGHGSERVRMYRATFIVDEMKSDVPV